MKWIVGLVGMALAMNAGAQSLEPRLYSNAPVGMNFLVGGYVFSTGAAIADPTVNLEDGELDLNMPVVAYARSFGLWGKSSKFDVVVPYGFLSGSAKVNGNLVQREVDGFADPSLRVSMNFMGAPALALPEFMSYKQNFVFGGSLQVMPPLGQYDASRIVNLGSNRWTIKPELGVSKTVGPVILELATAAALFTDNTDYNNRQTKEQAPLYSAQGHLVYTFPKGIWAAFDWTYYVGGQSTVDGNEKQDRQENSRVGVTLAFPVNKYNSVKLYASTGVSTRTGSDFDTYGLLWQYRWGGGL
jgi:hypothetical protein